MKELKIGDSFLFDGELWEVLTMSSTTCMMQNITTQAIWIVSPEFINHVVNLSNPSAVSHVHTLKLYQGFTDTYQYCTECNHKEKP